MATRWAHREDIEAGDWRLISYHGSWYRIEKYDSMDLGYQITDKLTKSEYERLARRIHDDESTGFGQSLSERIDRIGE